MPEPKTNCTQCNVEILQHTADRTGGFCMPCAGGSIRDPSAHIPLQRVGYWDSCDRPNLPDPATICTAKWDADEQIKVLAYLNGGSHFCGSWGHSFCRFKCGISDTDMGSSDLFDGYWLWPEGYSHYIEIHNLSIPEPFLKHMRNCNYSIEESMRGHSGVRRLTPEQEKRSIQQWKILAGVQTKMH